MTYKKRLYKNFDYRQLQSRNSEKRSYLDKEKQQWLKINKYKNSGWSNVISLYEKINQFLLESSIEEINLEDIFIEVDKIGNKYQTSEERKDFYQKLSQINQEISLEVDKVFPNDEEELIFFDFTNKK